MTVYIAGPITGVEDYEERFAEAARILIEMGHTVINPAGIRHVIAGDGADYHMIMRADKKLLEIADAICLLPGWEASKGAQAEYQMATRLDKVIMPAKEVEG